MHIALYKPDIPQNTAAIIRLAACLNLKLHIIEPCGFNLHDPRFKRVVMDYLGLGKISCYSPISNALLGNEEGDEVVVKAPIGDIIYEILEVQYI